MSDTAAPEGFRTRLAEWLDRPQVRNTIIGVIVFNAIILGMETSDTLMASWGPLILALDRACLAIFVIEIALKLVAHGPRFFRSGWNLFDFVIVGIALVPARAGPVGPAGPAHPAGAAHPVGGPVAAPRGGRSDDSAAGDGVGVPADVDHLLHRRGHGDEALFATASPNGSAHWAIRSTRCSRS
jgi:hypothetical protein